VAIWTEQQQGDDHGNNEEREHEPRHLQPPSHCTILKSEAPIASYGVAVRPVRRARHEARTRAIVTRMAQTVRRLMVIAIAVVVIVGAVAWVSVTFTDRSFACGTALGEARHGEVMPAVIFGSTPPSPWTPGGAPDSCTS